MAVGMKKGLALIMLANLINLIIGLVNGFVLPKFLSVETYAMIKTYTLYSTYAGIFHLGYLDGMYLKYGGKEMLSVSAKEYGNDFKNIVVFQFVVAILVLILGWILADFVLMAFAVVLFFKNVTSCYQMFFQATGEFKLYSNALNYGTILSFIVSILLIFVFHSDDYKLYIGAQVLSTIVITIYLGIILNKSLPYFKGATLSKQAMIENIRSGFVLMIGNFSNNLFTSIDRWFVKILMTTFHFAAYSFAVSIDSLITVFITPLYITLYNAFCKDHSPERILSIKRLVMIWGFVLISFAFLAKWVVETYLPKYVDSLPILFILSSAQVFYAVIKGVYVNYFKALKKQTQYFWQIVAMLFVAIALSLGLYLIYKSMMSLAVAALLTAVIWLVINEVQFKELRFSHKDWIYLTFLLVAYIFLSQLPITLVAMGAYLVLMVIMSLLFMREQCSQLYTMIINKLKRNK